VSARTITTSDGRRLAVYESGDPAGHAVLAIYGTPMGGMPYARHDEDARARGIRLVTYDRPGYGGSDPRPGRKVADCIDDVAEIADALGLGRFGVWGVSGGGPHALACAALLGDRVAATASLAAVAPFEAEGLDWLDGMGEDNLEEFGLTVEGREALEPYLQKQAAALTSLGPSALTEIWASLLSPVDAAVATDDLAAFLLDNTNTALAERVDGWLDDDLAFARHWGFAVDEIAVPVLLLQGEQDRFVPPSHGRWLAERIPGVDARLLDGDGHLTLIEHRVAEVHGWLLEHLG
jgi:pimeloyl-ACP methyl ester carboxylesterase